METSEVRKLLAGRLAVIATGSKVFRVHKDRVVIGSVESADVRLSGDGISPIHAVIEIPQDGGILPATVYDLASSTGVFVNGEKIVTRKIRSGDEITIGRHKLKFSMEEKVVGMAADRTRMSVDGRKLYLDPHEDLQPLILEDSRDVKEIFDFSAMQNRALEVVMSWSGSILDVEHFTRFKQVSIGSEKYCDFVIPPLRSGARFPIIQKNGEQARLSFDASMSGVVQRQGELVSLEQLRAHASNTAYGSEVAFGDKDFAKITVGEVDFYLSFTQAPPRLKRRALFESDPLYHKILGSSVLFTALAIAAMLRIDMPQQIEVEEVPERIATILYQPERFTRPPEPKKPELKKPEEPKKVEPTPRETPKPKETTKIEIQPKKEVIPKPVPKTMETGKKAERVKAPKPRPTQGHGNLSQNEAREGEGARAQGREGTRGEKKAPKVPGTGPQNVAKRPSAMGGKERGGGASHVPQDGNVDLLKGAGSKILNILGSSSAQLGGGGEKLSGFGGFTTQGGGGLALSGDGKGGGGTAESLGGLGQKGIGGGRVGTGLGAAGSGSGIIGGQTRVRIKSGGPEEAVVMGSIDADAVEAALLAHKDEFRYCYEKEINAETPHLAGRVSTSFVIGSSGRVTQAGVASSSLKSPAVERCIVNVIKRIDFPIPRGGGVVQVTYPFKFQSNS